MKENIYEHEVRSIERLLRMQLPPYYKSIGLGLALTAFVALIINKYLALDMDILPQILKNLLLASMLVMSISRDKDEDEMIIQLRARSYQWAFVCGVAYALVQPLVNLGVDSVLSIGQISYDSLATTQVLFFMLIIQLLSFHFMKKINS